MSGFWVIAMASIKINKSNFNKLMFFKDSHLTWLFAYLCDWAVKITNSYFSRTVTTIEQKSLIIEITIDRNPHAGRKVFDNKHRINKLIHGKKIKIFDSFTSYLNGFIGTLASFDLKRIYFLSPIGNNTAHTSLDGPCKLDNGCAIV